MGEGVMSHVFRHLFDLPREFLFRDLEEDNRSIFSFVLACLPVRTCVFLLYLLSSLSTIKFMVHFVMIILCIRHTSYSVLIVFLFLLCS